MIMLMMLNLYAGVISYLNEKGELLPQFTAEGAVKKLTLYSEKSSIATLTDKMILSLHVVQHDGTLHETLKLCFQLCCLDCFATYIILNSPLTKCN